MMKMKKVLILINDAPYGTEKAYNALRLAMQIQKDYEGTNCVFCSPGKNLASKE
jgi:sulfur relay (sulfurtransferase) complex TusBCD TusD component (DsrE family)